MDKITRQTPQIRKQMLRAPIVFAPNVQVTQMKSWPDHVGIYAPLMQAFKQQQNVQGKVLFLPNIVSPVATIEERAKGLSQMLADKRKYLGDQKVHLVTHSFAGVDARAAISMFGADENVKSLTTIATPHTGLTLIQKIMDKSLYNETKIRFLERAFGVVGLGIQNVEEFGKRNMADFNLVCEDSADVNYYSFGSKKRELQISELLRPGYEIITEHKIQYECDGMVEVGECAWGQYLVTFDNDHFEVIGLAETDVRHVANLVTDNLRRDEVEATLTKSFEKKSKGAKTQKKVKAATSM